MEFIFFSDIKKTINYIERQLLEMKSICDDILFNNVQELETDTELDQDTNENVDKNKNQYTNENVDTNENQDINEKDTICHHTFIDDSIDIDCEKSQNIRYCSICYYTLPYRSESCTNLNIQNKEHYFHHD